MFIYIYTQPPPKKKRKHTMFNRFQRNEASVAPVQPPPTKGDPVAIRPAPMRCRQRRASATTGTSIDECGREWHEHTIWCYSG